MTPLERLIDRHVPEHTMATLRAATEKIAEDLAKEVLTDEEFRRTFKAMIQVRSRALFEALMRKEKARARRRRPRRTETR
jgi:hypothetical protein